jgi:hypothetical protein
MKIVLKCNRLAAVNLQAFEMKIALLKETAGLWLTIQKNKRNEPGSIVWDR